MMSGSSDLAWTSRAPFPGDLLVARVPMSSWEEDDYKGSRGEMAQPGDVALVIQTWRVGNSSRMRVLMNDVVLVFSCNIENFRTNWNVTNRHPE